MYSENENNRIMDMWKRNYPEEYLFFDGACDEQLYNTSSKKILFILKEVAAKDDEGNPTWCVNVNISNLFIPKWISTPDSKREKHPAYKNCFKIACNIWNNAEYVNSTVEINAKRLAFMNLSKIGGFQYSDNTYLSVANNNYHLLRLQFKNLNPDVVVVATNKPGWDLFNEKICHFENLRDERFNELKIRRNESKIVFYTCHPSSSGIYKMIPLINEYIKAISPSPDATV